MGFFLSHHNVLEPLKIISTNDRHQQHRAFGRICELNKSDQTYRDPVQTHTMLYCQAMFCACKNNAS